MAEQYIFDVRRAAVQPTLSIPRLPSTASGTLGTQLAYFMLLWVGHPGDSLVVVDETGNENLEVTLQARGRNNNSSLRFIRAVFQEFRETLGGRFMGSEVFRTEDAELLVDVIEVTLKSDDDVIPLRTAFCHLDQFYEVVDIRRLTGNRFRVTKKYRQYGDKEPNGNLAGMIAVHAESHADVVDTVNRWIQEQIHPYIGYRQQGYPASTHLQGVATTGPDAVTIVSDRRRVRDGVSVIFASGTASGMEALRIAVGGSVSAVSVEVKVVSQHHRYKDNYRKSRVVPRLSIVTGGLACHAPATVDPPSSPPSQWSLAADDDELDVGDSEEEEEPQAGGWQREVTPAPGYVPLPEMKGFQHVRLPDGRIAWLAPPRPRSPAADPVPLPASTPPPPPPGTPPPPPPGTPPPPAPRWRTARAAQDDEDDTTVACSLDPTH